MQAHRTHTHTHIHTESSIPILLVRSTGSIPPPTGPDAQSYTFTHAPHLLFTGIWRNQRAKGPKPAEPVCSFALSDGSRPKMRLWRHVMAIQPSSQQKMSLSKTSYSSATKTPPIKLAFMTEMLFFLRGLRADVKPPRSVKTLFCVG